MLGVSGVMRSPDDGGAAAAAVAEAAQENGGSSEGGGPVEESGGGGGGNRWPRAETLALLKIRSDMDVAFRDSSLKGPLWEEVSRKMADLGFHRSAKKCREKFENVYKYHKRTKDGRAAKSDGKTYRFFDQLEALENAPPPNPFTPPRPAATASLPTMPAHVTVSSISPTPLSVVPPQAAASIPIDSSPLIAHPPPPPPLMQHLRNSSVPPQGLNFQASRPGLMSDSTSSSTSSDEDIQRRRGRKRKWKDCFHRLVRDVIQKQEELQKKFLDSLEKRERERMAREEAWRVQEIARVNREHDLLVQERSIAAAKDAAVIAFLQKVTDQHNLQIPPVAAAAAEPPSPPPPPQQPEPPPAPPAPTTQPAPAPITVPPPAKVFNNSKTENNGGEVAGYSPAASSSRWPKAEVQALINLRTSMDLKYQENGPKGPLWEEISSAMAKLGYNRSSKRCKEKWENINKYFKKVKESNKKRPEDAKTCPYFHQLEAIYKERAKEVNNNNPMVPIMAQPEQQWPIPNLHRQQLPDSAMQDQDNRDNESDDHNINDEDDDDDDDEGLGFEILANKPHSSVANAAQES